MAAIGEVEHTAEEVLSFSPRIRFALKTALAITIAYMVPLSMGWNQPYQGAVAIMVIAAAGPLQETLGKGVMRVLGTIAGALIGLGLIALFPQDPFYYFLSLSLFSALLVYAYYAYRGDGTFLLVTLMVMVLIFNEGKVDDRFLYAVDRSWTTAFGIFVYAMVNLYLWPEKSGSGPIDGIRMLHESWLHILTASGRRERSDLLRLEEKWERSVRGAKTVYPGGIAMDRQRWAMLQEPVRRINRILLRMELMNSEDQADELNHRFPDMRKVRCEIVSMAERASEWWHSPERLQIPADAVAVSVLDQPRATGEATELQFLFEEFLHLHAAFRELLVRLDRFASPEPDPRELITPVGNGMFVMGDPEIVRSTLKSLLVFWSGLLFWYYFYPPLGYTVAGLGLVLSLVTFGLSINPLALIGIYSLSFLFSFIAYVGILPHLYEGWQLGLYIFGYMFLTFLLIPVPLALFFALGLSFQYILNDRIISFEIFLAVLILFYLFLGLLLFFYYLPYSNRPESAFQRARRDWRRRFEKGLSCPGTVPESGRPSLERMRFHASKIDRRYFSGVDFEALESYLKEAERLSMLAELYQEMLARLPVSLCRSFRIAKRYRLLSKDENGFMQVWAEVNKASLRKIGESGMENRTTELSGILRVSDRIHRTLKRLKLLERKTGMDRLEWSRF